MPPDNDNDNDDNGMPDREFVELDEEGSPTGRSFGGSDDDGKTVDDFEEIDESDLPAKERAKARLRRAKKRAREGAEKAVPLASKLAEDVKNSAKSELNQAIKNKKSSSTGRTRRRRKNADINDELGGDRNLMNEDFRGAGLKQDIAELPGDGDFAGVVSEPDDQTPRALEGEGIGVVEPMLDPEDFRGPGAKRDLEEAREGTIIGSATREDDVFVRREFDEEQML